MSDEPINFGAKLLESIKELKEEQIKEGQIIGLDTMSSEEIDEALLPLLDLYNRNRIKYEREAKKLALKAGVSWKTIDEQVQLIIKKNTPRQLAPIEEDPSTELIVIAKRHTDLWHSQLAVGYASFERDGHFEHHLVSSREFKDWLADRYGENHKREIDGELVPIYPKQEDQREAQFAIEAYARRGEEKEPKIRVIAEGNDLWIDRGDQDWSGIRVNADGWKVDAPLVPPLVRGKGMRALPLPRLGGRIDDLRPFVNLPSEDFVLFCGTIATIFNAFGHYLTVILCGPPGSGKTTATRVIRALTDPHAIRSKRFSSVRDLMHSQTHLVALENVSRISPELSDAICALNTATEYEERKYYSQGEQWTAGHHSPVIINGVPSNLADRTDLADRTVTFAFDYLGENVRSEDVFWRKFDEASPRLLGVILDGLVGAMKVRQDFGGDTDAAAEVLLDGWRPRFVDAVVWGEAACRAMGFAPGQFVTAYKNSRDAGKRWIGENNSVCIGIRKLIAKERSWRGYPRELLHALRPYANDLPNEVWLSRDLPHMVPILRDLYDIHVQMNKCLEQNDNGNGIVIGVGKGR
jgi:hypothetical protein